MSLMGRLLKGLLYVTLKEGLNMTGFFHQKVFKKTSDLKPARNSWGDDFRFSFKVMGFSFKVMGFSFKVMGFGSPFSHDFFQGVSLMLGLCPGRNGQR